MAWTSPYLDHYVERIAINAKVMYPGQDTHSRMVAASYGGSVHLWHIMNNEENTREIGMEAATHYHTVLTVIPTILSVLLQN
jgi:folylpolyglutamate synthase/dihydropteroate synthase